VIAGDLDARAPQAETDDFTTLADRFNRMTDHLLDAQSQLVRAEKLASVGRLAAGIAHEIGNPLGGAATYVEVLRRRGGAQAVTGALSRELARIDRIVRSLLDYAHPHDEALQPVSVAFVLTAAFELLQAQGTLRSVRARLDLPAHLPRSWAGTPAGAGGGEPAAERGRRRARRRAGARGPPLGVSAGARGSASRRGRGRRRVPRAQERRPSRSDIAAGAPEC
jgi:signal transduction histidine kinase